ncbi:phosphoglucosamine mutase [Aestuariirhabdus litorea]|uniref:Phosphoglucosamine mutase n=1 Tax=Aestuariirhabdus litorea TaxID=2528527 RepID=A0A3P3VLZ0_9GAMM|nr:phosphoglucosamine mutase [Aestuariirhabdus litorea]RRJ83347.1 phosphoglucosamine mutase [Aestuariirhabdus litorea]RWW93506.1 phosphoglucosamine mutase [Endozoicomonadaceae bacterium GTF-13]
MARKYFGTDGIRGVVGKAPITPEFILKLGWAAGKVFAREGRSKILIGKDTRISGYMFESALEAGLSAAGVDVCLLGPMPTPGIAYLTRTFNAQAGIVISASHNPYTDNGFKFFSANGTKLADNVELAIEEMIDQPMTVVPPDQLGKVTRIDDAAGRYIEYCKGTVTNHLDLRGMRIVVDGAHGATYHMGPAVFRELGAEVFEIGVKPNGLNINRDVGSTSLGALRSEVIERRADLGIAFDGDGDRVMMVDDRGEVVDGDQLLFIIACARHQAGKLDGGVVGTLMTNLGMELGLKKRGIEFARAKVGDRYVNELMNERGWQLGGESSGHIICRHVSTTGDGIVAALQVVRAVRASGESLRELCSAMTMFPQTMINVRLPVKVDVVSNPVVVEAVAQAEAELADSGRVLLRPSGTEPVVRVMVEGENADLVDRLARQLAAAVESVVVS